MLAAILCADSFTESSARWAYLEVVCTRVWPSSLPNYGPGDGRGASNRPTVPYVQRLITQFEW